MQEILLFGQVSAEIHQTVRQQLAGLARMPPQSVLERHLVFRPLRPPGLSNLPAGGGGQGLQQQELQKTRQMLQAPLNYVQLVCVQDNRLVGPEENGSKPPANREEDGDTAMTGGKEDSQPGSQTWKWSLEYRDTPEPGTMSITSRTISKTQILDGDPIQFLKDLGYE